MTVEQLDYLNDAPLVPYHERWAMACERQVVLNVYVPTNDDTRQHIILPGSAIVGLTIGDGTVLIYFEGDKFHNGMSFADKMRHAAERMVTGYPTVARATVPAEDLHNVATYNVATHEMDVIEQATLTRWMQP